MKENWRYKPTTTRCKPRAERAHFTHAFSSSTVKLFLKKSMGCAQTYQQKCRGKRWQRKVTSFYNLNASPFFSSGTPNNSLSTKIGRLMSKLKDQPLLFLTELSLDPINKARYNKPSVIIWNQSNFMGGLVIVWVMRVFLPRKMQPLREFRKLIFRHEQELNKCDRV